MSLNNKFVQSKLSKTYIDLKTFRTCISVIYGSNTNMNYLINLFKSNYNVLKVILTICVLGRDNGIIIVPKMLPDLTEKLLTSCWSVINTIDFTKFTFIIGYYE